VQWQSDLSRISLDGQMPTLNLVRNQTAGEKSYFRSRSESGAVM
jgi:hypothetical protein